MKIFHVLFDLLTSRFFVVAVLIVSAIASIPGTLMENPVYYRQFPFLVLPLLLGLSTLACTIRNFSRLSAGVLLVHAGFVIVIIGFIVRAGGYVATVNIYEDDSTDTAYRWDLERDMPLGYDVAVGAVHREYYPSGVMVGVEREGVKGELLPLAVGQHFDIPPYRISVERLDPVRRELGYIIFRDGAIVATPTSTEDIGYPAGFPYRFRLVAFQGPRLKRTWVDIALSTAGRPMAEGITEVNRPFTWNNESFYNTAISSDLSGRTYVGIQVVRDPGRPLVFAGFIIAGIGVILLPLQKSIFSSLMCRS